MKAAIQIIIILSLLVGVCFTAVAEEDFEDSRIVVYKLKAAAVMDRPVEAPPQMLRGYKSRYLHPENLDIDPAGEKGRWMYSRFATDSIARKALAELKSRPEVSYCYLMPQAYPAGSAVPAPAGVAVDSFVDEQLYHQASPVGFDSAFAWLQDGGNGKGVTVADVEGDWDKKHHDLRLNKSKIRGSRAGSGSSWYHHGTAVAGIINAKKNLYGVTGIAYKAKLKLNSIFRKGDDGRLYSNVSDTIYAAAKRLKAGDIILIEVQFGGLESSGDYIPVEYYQDCFEAIQYAVARGIIVVEAAGNGGQNLDDAMYEDRFDVEARGDSGAIMVGAGGAHRSAYPYSTNKNNNRVKLWFSNYGKRVDIHNWGEYVVSTGYGDLENKGKRKTYTGTFSGTSSASALTAGLCASLQGVAKELLGRPLTPGEMRYVLKETGDSQRGAASKENIGPRPNLRKAIEFIQAGSLEDMED